jgi:hypothetical protein
MDLCFEAGRKGYREVAAQTVLHRIARQYNRSLGTVWRIISGHARVSIVTPDDIGSNRPHVKRPDGCPVFPAHNLWSKVCKQDS